LRSDPRLAVPLTPALGAALTRAIGRQAFGLAYAEADTLTDDALLADAAGKCWIDEAAFLVQLTERAMTYGQQLGALRNQRSHERGDRNKGFRESRTWSLDEHVLGARGEVAAAIYYGLPIPRSVDTFKRFADLGYDIEVRATKVYAGTRLIVRPADVDTRRYVLASPLREGGSVFVLRGWIRGAAAKAPQWLTNPGHGSDRAPAYFLPGDALAPMATLEVRS
jgi:hypothetical protein